MKIFRIIGMVFATIVLSATFVACSDDDDDAEGVSSSGKIKGHSYVDLGLSVKWATCNVGASSPSDFGDYFAWGETKAKSSYTEENYELYEEKIGDISGNSEYDAARANWGGTWRMPIQSEMDELVKKCEKTWTMQGDHYGYKVTGPNGNSIFFPAAGYMDGTTLHTEYGYGEYWSGTYWSTSSAISLSFDDDGCFYTDRWSRYRGRTIRPVSE